jgi:hypothetical protein
MITTRTPELASPSAIELPSTPVPPVITAVFPSTLNNSEIAMR